MMVLMLSIAAYKKLGKVLITEGVCFAALVALRGLTADSVLATIELRILLIQFICEAVSRFPLINLTVYADDTGLAVAGPPDAMVRKAVNALDDNIHRSGV